MSEEEIAVPVQLKRWSKSGLIEEARVPDQNIFQTEEFDRKHTGDLLIEDCLRRKDVKQLILEEIGHHELIADSFWNLFENNEPNSEYRETAEKHSEISAVLKELLAKLQADSDKTLKSGRGGHDE